MSNLRKIVWILQKFPSNNTMQLSELKFSVVAINNNNIPFLVVPEWHNPEPRKMLGAFPITTPVPIWMNPVSRLVGDWFPKRIGRWCGFHVVIIALGLRVVKSHGIGAF